jgi:hypothetical protein
MNYLVELHAQVCTVSEGLLERTMNAVLGELADEAVKCFSQVKEFGTGGLLTVSGLFIMIWFRKPLTRAKGCYGINVHPEIPRVLRPRDGRREDSRGPVHTTDYKCIFTAGSGPRTSTPHFKTCRRHCRTQGGPLLYNFYVSGQAT